jgi:putative ABC transport system ATP-binding protein
MTSSAQPLIALRQVGKTYELESGPVHALRGLELEIADGEFVAVMGPSGSGKSTLLQVLGCLQRPSTGTYMLAGEDIRHFDDGGLATLRNRRIGFVFQAYNLLPRTTAAENVELPLVYREMDGAERRRRADAALSQVGLAGYESHFPNQLSGGQQQRVAIARALVAEPAVILADEPTGALETRTGQAIMELFRNLNSSGVTIILITHDGEVAAQACRRIEFRDGAIVADGAAR